MKKCIYCAEEIQDSAIKCRHCGEFLDPALRGKKPERPWHFRDSTVVMALLCLMVFALPLVWLNPYYSRNRKIVISVIALAVSWAVSAMVAQSLKGIEAYYQTVL